MRLQLTIAAALVAVTARADTGFESKIQVYADSDHTQVVSPLVQARADVTPTTGVSLGYVADAVSSASVDVVTQASPTTIHDLRHQVSGGVSHIFGELVAKLDYSFSREHDYLSHTLGAGVERTLFDKNTTLGVGYGLSLNTVRRANDINFERALDVQTVNATWTQLVSPRVATQVTYELAHAAGLQSSPYRFVPVRTTMDAAPDFWVAETDPDTRWRHALVLAINRAVGEDSAVQGDYRIYHDTWGITSHTLGARYFVNLSQRLELRLRHRFYVQNGATFYEPLYQTTAKYMTIDRELSPLWSETLGGKLSYQVAQHVEAELKVEGFYYHYSDFPLLQSRTGANVGVGVALTY